MTYQVAYPYRIDRRGRTAAAADERHLHELIEQVLFTRPGERLHRPDFGCGLLQMAFDLNGEAAASSVQMTVQGALQATLGERIQVDRVSVRSDEGTLRVTVAYRPRSSSEARTATFEREV